MSVAGVFSSSFLSPLAQDTPSTPTQAQSNTSFQQDFAQLGQDTQSGIPSSD